MEKKKVWYWLSTIGEGLLWTAGYYTTDLLKLFPEHTLAYKIAVPLGFASGFIFRRWRSTKDKYQKDQLPSGITKILDKIPDAYTGEKGSRK